MRSGTLTAGATTADVSLTTNVPVLVAIIAAAATVGSGLVAGLVALINVGRSNRNEHLKWHPRGG